jgi:hypothetical protein
MAQGSKADLLQLVVAWIAIVALLTWATYFVVWTSPHDQGSTTNSVIENINSSTCCANGTVITPGSEVQYIIDIQTQVPASTGFCGGCPLPNGKGYVYGPTELRPNNPTISLFELNYAVFTFTFCPKLTTGCTLGFGYPQPNQPAPNSWLSGPQGNISQFIITQKHDPLLSGIFENPLFTVIVEMDTAGNYTLHYHNFFSTNATGTVAVGVQFSGFLAALSVCRRDYYSNRNCICCTNSARFVEEDQSSPGSFEVCVTATDSFSATTTECELAAVQ